MMIDGTEKPKIPSKFAKRAAQYNAFGYNKCTFPYCLEHYFVNYVSFFSFSLLQP